MTSLGSKEVSVVTGAFSYTGKYITRRLLAKGQLVRTLTGHPNNPNPFGERVSVYPFYFDQYDELVKSLQGATTLYNTYWIRFAHGAATFEQAVENTSVLIKAAEQAGIQRIVRIQLEIGRFDQHECGRNLTAHTPIPVKSHARQPLLPAGA